MTTETRSIHDFPGSSRWRQPVPAGLAVALFLCLFALWAPGPLGAAGDDSPDLSGHWEIDRELSEDPLEKMRESQGVGPRDGGGLRGGGGFGGRGGGHGSDRFGLDGGPGRRGGPDRPSHEELEERMEEMRRGFDRLIITQDESRIRIVFADGRELALTTDNKKNPIETPHGTVEVRARWRDAGLVVKTRAARRSTTETYYVTADGSLLTVLVEAEAPGPAGVVSFKRIYRPYEPAAKQESEDQG